MPREELLREPLPPFVRLKTTPDMTKVATNLVIAKKAIAEIAKIEQKLLAGGVTKADFRVAMLETEDLANIVAKKAQQTVQVLRGVKTKVQAYKGKLEDAVG